MTLRRCAALIVGAGLLAACATTTPAPPETAPAPEAAAPAAPIAPSGRAAPGVAPSALRGAAAAAVDAMLGAADFVKREGKGEYRRYDFSGCALMVFLYPDDAGGLAVEHLDAAPRVAGAAKPDLETCLGEPQAGS